MQIIHSCPVLKKRLSDYTGDHEFTCAVRDLNIPWILSRLSNDFPIGTPHDTYEAYLAIVDKIENTIGKDMFYGTSETTVINRNGTKSLVKDTYGSFIFSSFDNNRRLEDALQKCEYVSDGDSFVYKQTIHTDFPKMITCVFTHARPIEIPETFHGRKLNCVVCLYGGHYISIINENEKTFLIDDDKVYQMNERFTKGPVYMAVYSDG